MKKTLLINYVYFPPVGHAIEALRYALGYHKANPDYEISLVLSKHTPYFLADLCPWIKRTYTVDLPWDAKKEKVVPELINQIPQSWDYLVSDIRSQQPDYCPEPFISYYKLANRYFTARKSKGFCGDKSIAYIPNQQLELRLPKKSLDFAKKQILKTKTKIGLLFAGHGDPEQNPSIQAWEKLIDALRKQYSDLSIYLFGKIKDINKKTATAGVKRDDIKRLLEKYPDSVDCFDIGLFNQLAIVKHCHLFISPHTGFGFAVLSVGTPWLTISGTHWAEYFYNGVPFYSVLPNCDKYPCYGRMLKKCLGNIKQGKKVLCMQESRLKEDLPEILKATENLIHQKWDYEACLKNHFSKLIKHRGAAERIYAFDGLHKQFLKSEC